MDIIIIIIQIIGLPLFGYIISAMRRNNKMNKLQDIKTEALVFAIQKNFKLNGFTEDYNDHIKQQMKEHNFVYKE